MSLLRRSDCSALPVDCAAGRGAKVLVTAPMSLVGTEALIPRTAAVLSISGRGAERRLVVVRGHYAFLI